MNLFKGDTVKRVEKLIQNGENRKVKLQQKVTDLQAEVKALRDEEENDFQQAILEDKEPSQKLVSDRKKAQKDLQEALFKLEQVDNVIQTELTKAKQEIDKERRQFIQEMGVKEFKPLYHEMDELKRQYLNKIIEYHNKQSEYEKEYRRTFSNVERRVGLALHQPTDDHRLNMNQRHQVDGHYSPMLYNEEVREALINGKIAPQTAKNKNSFNQ
ncbi:hypothetical protein [Halobacillus sp. Cin3]|uniref:hypothetical protein n=1 Tax=Halobacillus sp. Cin3 TaxID=2928441 RepID=UPI00248E7217|nr:hypothetical protein [Halobacillus sp. Cin3]